MCHNVFFLRGGRNLTPLTIKSRGHNDHTNIVTTVQQSYNIKPCFVKVWVRHMKMNDYYEKATAQTLRILSIAFRFIAYHIKGKQLHLAHLGK